jgi:hypothetical protein
MLPNRESGPQNQPNAKVAVSVLVGAAASMGGIAVRGTASVISVSIFLLVKPKKIPSPANTSPTTPAPTITVLRAGATTLIKSAIDYPVPVFTVTT